MSDFFQRYKITIIFVSIILIAGIFMLASSNANPRQDNVESAIIEESVQKETVSNKTKEESIARDLVLIKTSKGDIKMELFSDKAPKTVANFKNYIRDEFYDGLIFHRVIDDFMIQGGGFDIYGNEKETKSPIKLESNNGLLNDKYTVAMARTNEKDSATSQFFINTNDNSFLNYALDNDGYAVFGKVVEGFGVVDAIGKVSTGSKDNMNDWPVEDIVIETISLI